MFIGSLKESDEVVKNLLELIKSDKCNVTKTMVVFDKEAFEKALLKKGE